MSQGYLYTVLLAPHVSEKSTVAGEKQKKVAFKVISTATKSDVKKAVELLFKALVKSVRIVNVKAKPKRYGKNMGRSKTWKKAYVSLREGQDISFTSVE